MQARSVNPLIKILGWLYVVACGVGLLVGTVLCLGIILTPDERSLPALEFIGPIFVGMALLALIPGLVGGVGLLTGQSWARLLILVVTLPMIFLFPVGTALCAFALWVFWDDEKRYPNAPPTSAPLSVAAPLAAKAQAELSRMGGVLLAMAGVGAGFVIAIAAGYRLNDQQAPAVIDGAFYPAIAALVLVLAAAVALWLRTRRH